ncbi:MAG TPA: cytochrome c oxidase subunit II [Bryobacteraceae bacterium]|nr:cytochrome c oxidase subunit II [Bryobacteraceae bacterium]
MPEEGPHRATYMRVEHRLLALAFGGIPLAMAQTNNSVENMFKPVSTPAQHIVDVSILVLAICAVIFLIVGGLLAYTLVRYRRRSVTDEHEPAQVYGSNQIEIAWTVLPIIVVLVLTMATARVISAIQNRANPADALQVTVVGHQWWWEFRYPGLGIVTANELHVPASTATIQKLTFLKLQSADVAHSFWVPRLAGKTDVIPGRVNTMWLEPKQTGTYLGNCAEYCGTQHANMLLRVIVHTPEEFEQWAAQQKTAAVVDPQVQNGRALFLSLSCVNCHTVSGTTAAGTFGPDLSHLMGRETLASGAIPNGVTNLRSWIQDPQAIKPGNLMPNMQLNDKELDQVVAYLGSLK